MNSRRRVAAQAVAVSSAVALVAAGCSSSGGDDSSGGANNSVTSTGAVSLFESQPELGLVPANTTESGGGKVVDNLFTGLVRYSNDGGKPVNAAAESIDTTDSKVYTIKLKSGMKFHDGTDVKAENFVKAWNFDAYSPNGMQNSSFFSDIQGFADVQSVDPDEDGPQKAPTPKAKEMSGLKVIDPLTFEVTLDAPFSIFPVKLGYSAFMPLPDVFFSQGADAFGKKPIGNGPLKFVSWQDNVEIKLTRFDEYNLDDKAAVKDVTYKVYQQDTAAYNDLLSNNLDFMEQVPIAMLAGDKWKSDLGDRARTVDAPITGIVTFPLYDKRFQNAKLRQAVSMAIDRQSINDKIFFGTRPPATSWSNPLAPGGGANDCTSCKFDPDRAKQLLQEAGGWTGQMTFTYNGDASHKEWMEAVAQSVKNTLGIDARAVALPTFAVFRQQVNAHKMTGPYRAAWQGDYPSIENWINPLYVTGGSSNDGLYSNPEVDALAKEAASQKNLDDAYAKFAEATKKIDADTPSMPIYYYTNQWATSEKLKKAEVTWLGYLDLSSVELA
jgi:oligopeptide transport system substrate-binding protein